MHIDDYASLRNQLEALADQEYKAFNAKITPDIGASYGVRLPQLKEIAKYVHKQGQADVLLPELQKGRSFEERLLFGFLLVKQRYATEAEMFSWLEVYVKLINNWALCDSFVSALRPLVKEHREAFWHRIATWVQPQNNPWEIRFALVLLNNYFAEARRLPTIFGYLEALKTEHYYVRMAIAWLLSTVYFSDRQQVETYLKTTKLEAWVVNKAVQKIVESRRLDSAHREVVKNLKRK